jgi:2'-5' RNA ligase
LAVRPPPDVIDALAELPRPQDAGVRWVPPEQWHVTLRFFGQVALDPVRAALDVGGLPGATVTLGPKVRRLGRQVLCVPAAGLDELAGEVVERTRQLGRPPEPRAFAGHLTLGRLRDRGGRGAARDLVGRAFDATFEARELEIVRSELSSAGARHVVELTIDLTGG